MIENEDIPTAPRSSTSSGDDPHTTIQVPTVQVVANAPALPYVTVDDLLALQIASEPQISPDGLLIAFTLQRNSKETNTSSSAIWIVNAKAGKSEMPRQVTSGTLHDIAPRWSPDGRTLAFLSDRSGSMQIYLLHLSGGEARQLSSLKQGVTEYNWRPDGTALLAHSPWKPADDRDEPDTSNIAVVLTRLDEQWDGMGYKQGRHQQLWLIPLEGEPKRLTEERVDIVQSCWSPDSSEIAFCANLRNDADLSVSMAVWIVTLATGQMHRLTPEEGLAQMPSWSADGQFIAYYYTADQTEASNISPWIVNTHGTPAPRPATTSSQHFTSLSLIVDELHNTVLSSPSWYPDGKSLLVTVQERGQVHLYQINTELDQMNKLTSGNGCYLQPQLSNNGETIAMIRTDWFTPGDVWSMDGNGENQRKLTGVNDAFLRAHQLIRPKRISWQSSDGLEIEGWLYLPQLVEGAKAPLILEVHGGPTLAWGNSYVHEFQTLAGKGFAVLAANPRGSSGYGEEFCQKILNNWGGEDFLDLMAGVDYVVATEPVNGNRLGIGGLSYGAYMTDFAITKTDRFKAAVSRNGISKLGGVNQLSDQTIWFDLAISGEGQEPETFLNNRSALPFADRIQTPLLLLHAENDLRCPFSESMQLFVALRKRKCTVELVRYPGVSHMMDWPDVGTPKQRIDRLLRTIEWFQHFV